MSFRRLALALLGACACLWLAAPAAQAEFGLEDFAVTFTDKEGDPLTQAGAHPFQMEVAFSFIAEETPSGGKVAEEQVKDILVDQVEGFVGNPTATPRCSAADFLTRSPESGLPVPSCPGSAAVGTIGVELASTLGAAFAYGAVYNLNPPPGSAAKLGFWLLGVPVTIEVGVKPSFPFNVTGGPTNISQALEVVASKLVLWGTPADPAHDSLRGLCLNPNTGESSGEECPAGVSEVPFLTLPRACAGPLETAYRVDSWQNPGAFVTGSADHGGDERLRQAGLRPRSAPHPDHRRGGVGQRPGDRDRRR